MAIAGDTFTTYLATRYIPTAVQTIFWNSWFMNQPYFEVVDYGRTPKGPSINSIIDYSVSTNAEVYAQGAPMPTPDTLNSVRAYFNKDTFQGSAKVYGDTIAQAAGDGTWVQMEPQTTAIDTSLKNLVDLMSTTVLTDLAAQVDSTTAYSDASLARATYSLASYEQAAGGALTLALMEDMLEGLQNTTYGMVDNDDLVWLMARNQLTNLSRLTSFDGSGAAFQAMNTGQASVDAGRVQVTKFFEGIPILVVPDMTNTEVYLMKRSTTKFYIGDPIKTQPKDVAEYANSWLSTGGVNLVVQDPRRCGKLTGVTA
jgi:hypothetical protein